MLAFTRTIESFTCPGCGLDYQGTKEPFPFACAGRFDCIQCAAEIHTWSGRHDYTRWTFSKADDLVACFVLVSSLNSASTGTFVKFTQAGAEQFA